MLKSVTAALLMVSVTMGCASKKTTENPELDQRVRGEPTANSPEAIAHRAGQVFSSAPGLSPEQKMKLSDIYTHVYLEALSIRTEIGQSKSLLFKLVSSKDFKSKEVDQLKKKIVALDHRRLDIMFKALDDVQKVVGFGDDKGEIYQHFRQYELPYRGAGKAN